MVLFSYLLAFLLQFAYLSDDEPPRLVILGNVQDAGSPHIGCRKACCQDLFDRPDPDRMVVSLGLIDPEAGLKYLFEATPDFPRQMRLLFEQLPSSKSELPDGIFLTHAHIGHYSGLMYLGREGLGSAEVPVYAMPRMHRFLETQGPWSQLVELANIRLQLLANEEPIPLTNRIQVTPFQVPHRDEYSETVGYRIDGPNRSALFIPDIDKWGKWGRDILKEIEAVEFAFVDATFFSGAEIDHRDISEIPHPSVEESMALFEALDPEERTKVHFIHLNHTNPLLDPDSRESRVVIARGFRIARTGDVFSL